MSFTVSKINGLLIFNDNGCYETRNPSTIWCIKEADKIYNWNDFNEIKIFTEDYEAIETSLNEAIKKIISNNLKFYLASSHPNLITAENAWFLQVGGETGNQDKISLYRQKDKQKRTQTARP